MVSSFQHLSLECAIRASLELQRCEAGGVSVAEQGVSKQRVYKAHLDGTKLGSTGGDNSTQMGAKEEKKGATSLIVYSVKSGCFERLSIKKNDDATSPLSHF